MDWFPEANGGDTQANSMMSNSPFGPAVPNRVAAE